jgi:hypothetical protein
MVNKKPGKTASESLRSKLEKSGLVLWREGLISKSHFDK